MTTEELMAKYKLWLENYTREFRLTAIDLNKLDPDGYLLEVHGSETYKPSKKDFMRFYQELQQAVSRQPSQYRFSLRKGYVVVNWLYGSGNRYYGECVCRGLMSSEFASLYPAMAACAGYANKPTVYRDNHGFVYIGP